MSRVTPAALFLTTLALCTTPLAAAAQEAAPTPAPGYAPAPVAPSYQAAPAPAAPASDGSIRDTSEFSRPLALSVMAYVPWWYGIGFGGKVAFEIPVAPNGFIAGINDQFSIEPAFSIASVDYGYGYGRADYPNVTEILPSVSGMWSFHFSPEFRAYGALTFGYGIFTGSIYRNVSINYFYYELSVGAFYKLTESIALRGEIGWRGLRAGVAFEF